MDSSWGGLDLWGLGEVIREEVSGIVSLFHFSISTSLLSSYSTERISQSGDGEVSKSDQALALFISGFLAVTAFLPCCRALRGRDTRK